LNVVLNGGIRAPQVPLLHVVPNMGFADLDLAGVLADGTVDVVTHLATVTASVETHAVFGTNLLTSKVCVVAETVYHDAVKAVAVAAIDGSLGLRHQAHRAATPHSTCFAVVEAVAKTGGVSLSCLLHDDDGGLLNDDGSHFSWEDLELKNG